jgi:hypothetical protein
MILKMNYNFIYKFYRLRLLPLLLFMLVPFYSYSQNWADNNAVWHYTQINFNTPPNQEYIRFTAAGDTLINGDTLKIILEEIISLNDTLSDEIYMKSDSNRVYYYIPEIEAYKLLYDFNANPGDTIEVYCRQAFNDSTITIYVDSISTIDVNGNILKVQHVSQIHSPTDEYWLEGEIIENIGWKGFMFPLHAWADPPYGGPLRCFQDDKIGLFKLTNYDCDYISVKRFLGKQKIWSVLHENSSVHIHPDDPYPFLKTSWYKIGGDTIIENKIYNHLLRSDDSLQTRWKKYGAVRETEEKVYYLNSAHNHADQEILLYDFTLKVGDTIQLSQHGYFLNYALDSVGFS